MRTSSGSAGADTNETETTETVLSAIKGAAVTTEEHQIMKLGVDGVLAVIDSTDPSDNTPVLLAAIAMRGETVLWEDRKGNKLASVSATGGR